MVTGVGGGGHGEQIIKALRLAKTKYRIVGTDMSPMSKGLAEVDHPYVLPPAADAAYLPAVLELCRRHRVKALFHGSEPELKVFSRERGAIAREGIFLPINPQAVIDTCMDKHRTFEFLEAHGFHSPRTVRIHAQSDLEKVDFLPAVLKPSVGGGGSANVIAAQTRDELAIFGKHLLGIYPEFIVQEYVGNPDCEYTVGVLLSLDGVLWNSIAVRRFILSSLSNRIKIPNKTGDSRFGRFLAISNGVSQGEIGPFPGVTRQCERIAKALGARGPVNIQCRYVGGKVYVFEINPRFSGTTSMRAMVGYNEPDLLVRHHVLGERIRPRFHYRSGVIMRGLQETFIRRTRFPRITGRA
jgi:carbamoyl-phosphate synthase large subunit